MFQFTAYELGYIAFRVSKIASIDICVATIIYAANQVISLLCDFYMAIFLARYTFVIHQMIVKGIFASVSLF